MVFYLKTAVQLGAILLVGLAIYRHWEYRIDQAECERFLPEALRGPTMFLVESDRLPTTPHGKVVSVKFQIAGSKLEHEWTCEWTLWPDGKLRIARAFPRIRPSRRD